MLKIIENNKIIIATRDDIEVGFIEGVQHDYEILKKLKSAWDKIAIDSKIAKFLQELPVFLDKKS